MKGNDPYFTGEWVREANHTEREMEEGHQMGNMLIWYQLDLSSPQPLQEDHVRRAVQHLYRKVPSLGLCFGNRDGKMWFRRATNPNVDFKVHHGVSLEHVRDSVRKYHFSSDTGPLFCVHLVYNALGAVSDPYNLEPTCPNRCHVIFGFHHAVTDGTSNMVIMGFFVSLLNDVLANKPVIDGEPLGSFSSNEETVRLINKKKSVLESNPELREKIASDIHFEVNHTPHIQDDLPKPNERKYTTSIIKVLDTQMTSNFLQRCRKEKLTVHSVFTALANMAIVQVLTERSVIRDSYVITNFHTINMRRYWECNSEKALGLHMGYPVMLYTDTPRDVHKNFWNYSRKLGESLKDYISSERILLDKAFAKFYPQDMPSADTHDLVCDYITSNMGNITNLVTEGGDYARVTNLLRGTTFHEIPYPMLLNCHTFRGIFTIICDYNIADIQKDNAEKICSQITKNLQKFVQ